MLWLYVLVWFLSAVSIYAGLDVLECELSEMTGSSARLPGDGARRPVAYGCAVTLLVGLGVWLPLGATSCVLLGVGLGMAAYVLVPVMGLDAQPAWVRREPQRSARLTRGR